VELQMNATNARETHTGISDSQTRSTVISDSGKVQVGALSPAFPTVRRGPDNATATPKVRIGAVSPAFPPTRRAPVNASDTSKVRIGAVSPAFPPRLNK